MQDLQTDIDQLKADILNFLALVTYENFGTSYDALADLMLVYRNRITDKKVVLDLIMNIIDTENLDENQDEVIGEVYRRLFGWCSPNMEIAW